MRRFVEVEAQSLLVRAPGFDWDIEGMVPEANPEVLLYVEVTGLDPEPVPGSSYDPETGAFTPPPVVESASSGEEAISVE